jgi:UDP-N-acetylmuramoylalanine--D-glutamate ligase
MKKNFSDFKGYIKGKKVAVLGIGVSNKPLIRYLASLGAKIRACDKKSREEIGDICNEFENMGVDLRFRDSYLEGLDEFNIIFKTPSIRPDIPELVCAREKGVTITSEIEEFVRYCPAKIIGVTGSDGKTTTTTIIYNMLKEEGYKTWLGGNIGTPLFDKLDEISENDMVVLELSSFQLMTMDVSPEIAIITNLSPNHLDIHKSMDEYIEAKRNIFKHQDKDDIIIINMDNDTTYSMKDEAKGRVVPFSRRQNVVDGACLEGNNLVIKDNGETNIICSMDEVKLPGLHNIENFLAASAAVKELCSIDAIRKVATEFHGVEHRIEFVREIDGVKYYNDSIATTPTRAIAGLNSFKQKVILIAGGYDKKIPFTELAKVGVDKVKVLILMGTTAQKIEDEFIKEMNTRGINGGLPIIRTASLEDAINIARVSARPGDIVTLSPACASFDMYKNFEEKGNKFKEVVNNLR